MKWAPGVPKKAELRIISNLQSKKFIFLTSLNKASSAEENDTKIIEFGWALLLTWINGLPKKHHTEGLSRYNSMLIGRKNQAKFENDIKHVSRNAHKIKITQPNSIILASFFYAEDVLFNDVYKLWHF